MENIHKRGKKNPKPTNLNAKKIVFNNRNFSLTLNAYACPKHWNERLKVQSQKISFSKTIACTVPWQPATLTFFVNISENDDFNRKCLYGIATFYYLSL